MSQQDGGGACNVGHNNLTQTMWFWRLVLGPQNGQLAWVSDSNGVGTWIPHAFAAWRWASLRRPIHDIEAGFVMSPMEQGMRVTSGVELTDRDAPPDYRQINYSVEMARQAYDMKHQLDQTPWMGRRPTLIDSLPMIGAAPRHDGLWFNFGHQHLGLSLAPGSAQLLTALIENTPPPPATAAFSQPVSAFNRWRCEKAINVS